MNMTSSNADEKLEIQTLDYAKEVVIAAPIEITWDAVLAELGPEGEMPDGDHGKGKPFPFVFEPWPGGRWFRDLGEKTGHLWGHVQVIKPPKLLELFGPCYISYPATNHIQYRLTAEGDNRTRLKITNRAFGYMPKDFMVGVEQGWEYGLKRIGEIAARMMSKRKGMN
jgi:uncharacterized protein YndB with AHSA1/START domain